VVVFITSTADNWQDVMYTGVDSVGIGKHPVYDNNLFNALYFVVVTMLSCFFWANMFVSTLVDQYTKARGFRDQALDRRWIFSSSSSSSSSFSSSLSSSLPSSSSFPFSSSSASRVIDHEHSTDVDHHPPPRPPRVCMSTYPVRYTINTHLG